MNRKCVVGLILVALLAGVVQPASTHAASAAAGGPTIQKATMQASGLLTPGQEEEVSEFIRSEIEKLKVCKDEEVMGIRNRLTTPYGSSGSKAFVGKYQAVLIKRLGEALPGTKSVVARTNMMIIACDLADHNVDIVLLPLIQVGMKDPDQSVRFWSARVVESIGRVNARTPMKPEHEKTLVSIIKRGLANESEVAIQSRLLSALAMLRSPESQETFLGALRERLDKPTPIQAGLNGEVEAMRTFYRAQFESRKANPASVSNSVIAKTGAITWRYISVIADMFSNGTVPPNLAPGDLKPYLSFLEDILAWSYDESGSDKRKPITYKPSIGVENWADILIKLEDWKSNILTAAPFNIPTGDLAAPTAPTAPAAAPMANPGPAPAPAPGDAAVPPAAVAGP